MYTFLKHFSLQWLYNSPKIFWQRAFNLQQTLTFFKAFSKWNHVTYYNAHQPKSDFTTLPL